VARHDGRPLPLSETGQHPEQAAPQGRDLGQSRRVDEPPRSLLTGAQQRAGVAHQHEVDLVERDLRGAALLTHAASVSDAPGPSSAAMAAATALPVATGNPTSRRASSSAATSTTMS